jgi:hypothetical protein
VFMDFHRPRGRIRTFIAAFSVLFGVGAPIAPAQEAKTPLTTDASRGELFELMGQIVEAQTPPGKFSQFAFRANFRFAHDALWRNPVLDVDPRSNQIFGIDISHHLTDKCKCKVDWALLADQKVAFAYLKATQGVSYYDRSFDPISKAFGRFRPGKRSTWAPSTFYPPTDPARTKRRTSSMSSVRS